MKPLNNTTHPLESLLQQHCPNGVEFKELGELWEKAPKSKMGANQAKNLSKNNGNICFTSGETHYFIDDYLVDGEFLFLNDGGTADIKYNSGKAYYTDHIFAFTSQKICVKFLYYFLKDKQEAINKTCFQGTGLKNLQKNKIEKFPIPLPPLEIQHKIVEILDAFTELQAELEAELEARLKQYHYYRNKLLSHDELENRTAKSRNDSDPATLVPYVRLGEACEILDNLRKPITKSKRTQGIYPYYGANGIQDYVNEYIFDGDFLLMGEDGSVINKDNSPVLNWVSGKFWVNNHAHILKEKSNTTNLRFVFFYLQTCDVSSIVRGVPPKINQQNLKTIQIPLPPLAVQNEIVELLDKFDTLTNDLTSGIPAEIEARKKQYEYYRERLLSFIAKD
ncbi:type I restriction modification DNA specificity domain-containing protein [Campylobacter upsaliensis]|uniref:restriction endonuclease subunit S n=1 Tax=Campylobacter upsaliensis TaxID=28080 RepID=UPI000E12D05D|nr:restriction endonuclease subunit S [Campylobacter upsaliensis]EAI4345028.1 restriction endonuclease subunit S [Campylobacter upsaliensis]TXE69362.1 restriction endonuclease subunit S [Campylobacter upsaliensis]CAG9469457.1 restriction endonuclease subunit S [Campylobacter upsaliensis]SUX20045.1 type I restriction modification DNA specificity domain-containing protein [Campylobacter upsaliensis]